MVYDKGLRCWGGPDRSLVVYLECGPEDEILSVTEPAKCEYEMMFSTPAACTAIDTNSDSILNLPVFAKYHDEL